MLNPDPFFTLRLYRDTAQQLRIISIYTGVPVVQIARELVLTEIKRLGLPLTAPTVHFDEPHHVSEKGGKEAEDEPAQAV